MRIEQITQSGEQFGTIAGYTYATICDTTIVSPKVQHNVYHGSDSFSGEQCNVHGGLPARGDDIDLVRHVEPPPARSRPSAFVGTVPFPRAPGFEAGAVYWAGEGGWVYHIDAWPGYDVNEVLADRIPDGKGGFRGPLLVGEQEIAIPARVPRSKIVKIGIVEKLRGGLAVKWSDE